MARIPNTRRDGGSFDEATINAVWRKARDSEFVSYKRDACGALIQRSRYGTTEQYGWEIDHIKPVSAGGSDDLSNLQPLHWENNRHKGDDYPNWKCKITG